MKNWDFFYRGILNHQERALNHPEMIETRGMPEQKFSAELVDTFHLARPYSVSRGMARLLLNTKGTKDIDKLPFNTFFIDVDFDVSLFNEKQFGFFIEKVRGIMVNNIDQGLYTTKEGDVVERKGRTIRIYALCTDHNSDTSVAGYSFNTFNIPKQDWRQELGMLGVDTPTPKIREYVINFVSNFLTLINNPDRQVELIDNTYSIAKNKRRERHGLLPIPKMRVLVPLGTLKEYIIKSEESERHVGYKFEVQGFWRQLRHPKYGDKPRVVWVRDHTRGKGILIRKVREVDEP